MAFSFEVRERRQGRTMSFSGKDDDLEITWATEYNVSVSGGDATLVSPYDVITAEGLPIVNQDVFEFGEQIIPFVMCRNKNGNTKPRCIESVDCARNLEVRARR